MFSAGDTFLIPDKHGVNHLHIIVSDPGLDPSQIVLAPVTTWEDYKDDTCILEGDDLKSTPFLAHNSCIDYQECLLTSDARLSLLASQGKIKPHKPVSLDLVRKIRSRAAEAKRIPNKCLMVLEAQNLV
jgi:hypothetical protein